MADNHVRSPVFKHLPHRAKDCVPGRIRALRQDDGRPTGRGAYWAWPGRPARAARVTAALDRVVLGVMPCQTPGTGPIVTSSASVSRDLARTSSARLGSMLRCWMATFAAGARLMIDVLRGIPAGTIRSMPLDRSKQQCFGFPKLESARAFRTRGHRVL